MDKQAERRVSKFTLGFDFLVVGISTVSAAIDVRIHNWLWLVIDVLLVLIFSVTIVRSWPQPQDEDENDNNKTKTLRDIWKDNYDR